MEKLSLSFETKQAAKERTKVTLKKTTNGEKKEKNHSDNFAEMTWDKEGLKQELENLPENSTVNWSEIARRYNNY